MALLFILFEKGGLLMAIFEDFEKAKEKLFIDLVPMAYVSGRSIFKQIKDVALVVYIKLPTNGEDADVTLSRSVLELWGKAEDEVIEAAMDNTVKHFKDLLCTEHKVDSDDFIWIRSNDGTITSQLFYHDCIKELEKYYSEFYFGFVSIYKVILASKTYINKADFKKKLIEQIGKNGKEDFLSFSVFDSQEILLS